MTATELKHELLRRAWQEYCESCVAYQKAMRQTITTLLAMQDECNKKRDIYNELKGLTTK